ncbi:hypothetical protein AcW1_000746 [Taiwanofungus camphoratus]|nr:hypothetical protein AcW2_000752 [Antrodia cinnamomea]KAI0936537.1 hypothetical protein AcV5_004646 [Antrodia cinnamomea]KAI0961751.1 hypothetical protein AcV7_000766 [Antrodia cinnamomea]KAI0963760.1 hypothetical protein AcW1_000746 [Antrodia cinnamomea]
MDSKSTLTKVAFLGPVGSHSYQCAVDTFGSSVDFIERQTITDVFNAVSSDIPFGLLPQENSIYGTVTETYDLLRSPEVGMNKFVKGEATLPVRHHLLVRRGVKLGDVHKILSHEQALGQCGQWISSRLPHATLVKTTSTSAAAAALSSSDNLEGISESAAICSALCATIFDNLEILQEDIQDSITNFTRFYIITNSLHTGLPSGSQQPTPRRALARIGVKLSNSNSPSRNRIIHLIISTLLTTFGLPATRIDRRPSLNNVPFEDVYLVELEDAKGPIGPNDVRDNMDTTWLSRVRAGVEQVGAAGGDGAVLGIW